MSYKKYSRAGRTELFVAAVIAADGSIKAAADELGVHVNTISRTLSISGIRFQDLRREVRDAISPRLFSDPTTRPDGLHSLRPVLGSKRHRLTGLPLSKPLFIVRNGIDYRGADLHQGKWLPEGLPALLQEEPLKKAPANVRISRKYGKVI